MEKKEMGVTSEDVNIGSTSNGYPLLSSAFESSEEEKSSLGFMELLGLQEYSTLPHLPSSIDHSAPKDLADTPKEECSEVSNQQPATPNSSSISSASSGALTTTISDQVGQQLSKTNKLYVGDLFLLTFLLPPFFVVVPILPYKLNNMMWVVSMFNQLIGICSL